MKMNEEERSEIIKLIRKIRDIRKQPPDAKESILWFAKNIKKIDLIINKKYVPQEILLGIIDDFYTSGSYEAAAFASYKLITQENKKIRKRRY